MGEEIPFDVNVIGNRDKYLNLKKKKKSHQIPSIKFKIRTTVKALILFTFIFFPVQF